MLDTVDLVRDLIKRGGDRTPLERQVVDLLKSMIAAGLTQHRAFDALYELHGCLTISDELEAELRQHRIWEGELVDGVDMTKAEALYRQWCQTKGVKRASMSRGNGPDKKDAPCLVYVARRLGLPTYAVAKAWRSRKK